MPTTLTTVLDSGEKIALEYVDYGVAGADNTAISTIVDNGPNGANATMTNFAKIGHNNGFI